MVIHTSGLENLTFVRFWREEASMSHQEKNNYASLISTILVFGYYLWHVSGMFRAGEFAGAHATSLIGKSILVLIVGSIIVNIVVHILFEIFHAIITRDPEPSLVVDERDKLIELRALRISHYILGAGFVFAMGALALEQSPFMVFYLLIFSFAVSSLAENIIQLFLYRRGF